MPAAERSAEAAQEHQYDRTRAGALGQMKGLALLVVQGEVGR
jgi:hypothetical protein